MVRCDILIPNDPTQSIQLEVVPQGRIWSGRNEKESLLQFTLFRFDSWWNANVVVHVLVDRSPVGVPVTETFERP